MEKEHFQHMYLSWGENNFQTGYIFITDDLRNGQVMDNITLAGYRATIQIIMRMTCLDYRRIQNIIHEKLHLSLSARWTHARMAALSPSFVGDGSRVIGSSVKTSWPVWKLFLLLIPFAYDGYSFSKTDFISSSTYRAHQYGALEFITMDVYSGDCWTSNDIAEHCWKTVAE